MLNHTYTSVHTVKKEDCGKKCHNTHGPQPLMRDNFLGEYKTELDKKKVLSNLGITSLAQLEWCDVK